MKFTTGIGFHDLEPHAYGFYSHDMREAAGDGDDFHRQRLRFYSFGIARLGKRRRQRGGKAVHCERILNIVDLIEIERIQPVEAARAWALPQGEMDMPVMDTIEHGRIFVGDPCGAGAFKHCVAHCAASSACSPQAGNGSRKSCQ